MQIILRQNDTISPNQFIFYTIDMVIHILLPPIFGGIFLVVERIAGTEVDFSQSLHASALRLH